MQVFIDVESNAIEITSKNEEIAAPNLDVFFSVTKNVEFKEPFRFGYNIIDNQETVASGSYPTGTTKYISTDQEYLVSERVTTIEPNKSYNILVWAINGPDYFEKLVTFDVSNRGQRFASWTFDLELRGWRAPQPYPTDGKRYFWDETTHSWSETFVPPAAPPQA
jgi:hypothetical protein